MKIVNDLSGGCKEQCRLVHCSIRNQHLQHMKVDPKEGEYDGERLNSNNLLIHTKLPLKGI